MMKYERRAKLDGRESGKRSFAIEPGFRKRGSSARVRYSSTRRREVSCTLATFSGNKERLVCVTGLDI